MPLRTPDAPLDLPQNSVKLIERAREIVAECRVSVGQRASYYSQLDSVIETGRQDGVRAIVNTLFYHINRVAAHLYSPTQLNFTIDTDHEYAKETLTKINHAGKILTRNWQKNNTDMLFGQGVEVGLRYGCGIMKQWPEETSKDGAPSYARALIMPWQFGVYREDIEDLHRQPAFVETSMLSLPEVWKRIYKHDDAKYLLERIKSHAFADNAGSESFGFFHQILSTSQLQTDLSSMLRPLPGGIVNLNSAPNYSVQGPEIGVKTVPFHELWLWGGDGWNTVQYIEPDILIYPKVRRGNLLGGEQHLDLQPYTVIRPNAQTNYFWGRSEITDLMELQSWLATSCEDAKRLLGLQVDKILAFIGDEGMTDEKYSQAREASYFNLSVGMDVKDLTPSFPGELLPMIDRIQGVIDKIGGFGNVLDGSGTPGVRSDNHAQSLIRTASPTLRDRSLLVERQCASAADLTFHLMQAKDATTYWTDAEKPEETQFTMAELPDDAMAVVDSHSSSPIFADDHQQLIFAGLKGGFVDADSAIDMLPLPSKELLHVRLKEAQKLKAAMLEQLKKEDPDAWAKALSNHGHR